MLHNFFINNVERDGPQLTAASSPTTIKRERIVAFPWQQKHFYIVSRYNYANNNKKGTYCCLSMATLVMRTRHDMTYEPNLVNFNGGKLVIGYC